ncbi:4'-phosphopantetheinyl transferase superfamily protein [Phenylobacterium sp.]|uniref:4'-phosphopantetheinyl transferase family protein n=1 Tax=Phenylobacterium sp. TaxID=1871053 RepID=UPI0035668855
MSGFAIVEEGIRVDIGECRLDTDADIALGDAHADLNDEERARARSFVFARDRDRFIRARGYLRRRLGAFVGVAPKAVPIATGEDGKPFLEGRPASFNLSHSGDLAVLAVTRGDDIGIDLETVDRSPGFEDQLDDLSRFCLNGEEQAALAKLPPPQRVRRFLSYWTAKEARMKLTGEGMALEPRTIALELSGGRAVGYLRPRGPDAVLRFIPLSRPDAICCLAVRRDSERGIARATSG